MRDRFGGPRRLPSGLRRRRSRFSAFARLALFAALGALAILPFLEPNGPAQPRIDAAVQEPAKQAGGRALAALIDPAPTLGYAPARLGEGAPLAAGMRLAARPVVLAPAQTKEPVMPAALPLPAPSPETRLTQEMLLPVPRPSDLRIAPAPVTPRLAAKPALRRPRAAAAAPAEDNRNFFQKLFGVQPSQPGTVLAYAAPQDDVVDRGRGWRLSPSTPPPVIASAGTAVYDISAKTVYMPNGERLEAHSGLGPKMDDPRYVHVRMHGATPPHVYTLTEREALFHGVRALRMHPVGGSGAIFGRAGLLTHSYLLGPGGDSNGCVSFKDYDRFLQAFLRGEVKRLVVVAGRG
jgi:hypothetical protein